jgi:hypothetical protein
VFEKRVTMVMILSWFGFLRIRERHTSRSPRAEQSVAPRYLPGVKSFPPNHRMMGSE